MVVSAADPQCVIQLARFEWPFFPILAAPLEHNCKMVLGICRSVADDQKCVVFQIACPAGTLSKANNRAYLVYHADETSECSRAENTGIIGRLQTENAR